MEKRRSSAERKKETEYRNAGEKGRGGKESETKRERVWKRAF